MTKWLATQTLRVTFSYEFEADSLESAKAICPSDLSALDLDPHVEEFPVLWRQIVKEL